MRTFLITKRGEDRVCNSESPDTSGRHKHHMSRTSAWDRRRTRAANTMLTASNENNLRPYARTDRTTNTFIADQSRSNRDTQKPQMMSRRSQSLETLAPTSGLQHGRTAYVPYTSHSQNHWDQVSRCIKLRHIQAGRTGVRYTHTQGVLRQRPRVAGFGLAGRRRKVVAAHYSSRRHTK